jgi:hypothetical protein
MTSHTGLQSLLEVISKHGIYGAIRIPANLTLIVAAQQGRMHAQAQIEATTNVAR